MLVTYSTLAMSAKQYASARQWKVFPLAPREKTPITAHGLKDGTADIAQIQRWWSQTPTANIGIATGHASGFFVVDVDGDEGMQTLASLEDEHGPIKTRSATTGGGGKHLLFQTIGVPIRNRAKLLPGIDVRGDGGYIVAPPSIHPNGQTYRWDDEAVEIAPAPPWLIELLFGESESAKDSARDGAPIEAPQIVSPSANGHTRYAAKALEAELALVQQAPEGTRNDTLNRAAFNLGQLVAAGVLERTGVERALEMAASTAGLTEREIRATVRSGIEGGMKQPRQLPEHKHSTGTSAYIATEPGADTEDTTENPSPQRMADDLSYLTTYPLTDAGNAECMVRLHGEKLRYDHTSKRWRLWDGQRWGFDRTGEAQRLMLATMRTRRDAFNAAKDENGWKFCLRAENQKNIDNALKSATNNVTMAMEVDWYDRDPFLACAGDVTLDLQTCASRENCREDYITLKLGADYDESASCGRWQQFMDELFPAMPEMVAYIRRAFGYCLTGDTREQVFFLCYGLGRNGKSTFLNILRKLAGEYAGATGFETFDADTAEARGDLAKLRACRIVTVIEADEGRRLAEARIKSITGGDMITARELYAMPFSYRPQFKLWMAMNHLPGIRGTDNGIWRRIHLIEFNQDFRGREDKWLEQKLVSELPGILNWALEGLRDWRQQGLNPPQQVLDATQHYRDDSDLVGQWIKDSCITGNGKEMKAASGFLSYTRWAKAAGIIKPGTSITWKRRMEEKGYAHRKKNTGNVFTGIGLLEEPEAEVML